MAAAVLTRCYCPGDCNCRFTGPPFYRFNYCGCKAHDPEPHDDPAPIGSRWYFGGHHWRVTEHTTHDGEAAVRLAGITCKAKRTDRLSVLLRHSERVG